MTSIQLIRFFLAAGLPLTAHTASTPYGGTVTEPPRPVARGHIPALNGLTLSGEHVVFPAVLHGKIAVLVIGFNTNSREDATGWARGIADDYAGNPGVVWYEMPVIASVPRLLRGWVKSRISSAISPVIRPRFVPIENDEPAWRQALAYDQATGTYVVVVDDMGTICWEANGKPTDAGLLALKKEVQTLQAAGNHAHSNATSN